MKYDNLCKNYIEYININCDNNNNKNNKTQKLQCDLIQNMLNGCIKFKDKKQNNKPYTNPYTNPDNKPSDR